MYFLSALFGAVGGLAGRSFEFQINAGITVYIRHIGSSPSGLPAVELRYSALHLTKPVQLLIRFEHCDFGFVPYYCVNEYEDLELEVYPLLADGSYGFPDLARRQRLIRLCAEYETELSGLGLEQSVCFQRTGASAEPEQLELFP